ncbi:hypothetical protein HMN09_01121200 [Mycena chlorophos]|uniref:Uncharacterized protein n=1 Tax=Mycena chlorophos TaxID=658473 RepID=A0A8H6VVR8_MYCCL|nr:hypothetical protein HMN09_01121200 [Mycena chlorophos]
MLVFKLVLLLAASKTLAAPLTPDRRLSILGLADVNIGALGHGPAVAGRPGLVVPHVGVPVSPVAITGQGAGNGHSYGPVPVPIVQTPPTGSSIGSTTGNNPIPIPIPNSYGAQPKIPLAAGATGNRLPNAGTGALNPATAALGTLSGISGTLPGISGTGGLVNVDTPVNANVVGNSANLGGGGLGNLGGAAGSLLTGAAAGTAAVGALSGAVAGNNLGSLASRQLGLPVNVVDTIEEVLLNDVLDVAV